MTPDDHQPCLFVWSMPTAYPAATTDRTSTCGGRPSSDHGGETSIYGTIAKQCKSIVDKMAAFRMRQQERLTREPLLELHALIHESALGRDVDRDQLAKLVQLAELPNVTIQIVPQSPANLDLTSSVCLLSFNDPDEPDSVFTDSVIGL